MESAALCGVKCRTFRPIHDRKSGKHGNGHARFSATEASMLGSEGLPGPFPTCFHLKISLQECGRRKLHTPPEKACFPEAHPAFSNAARPVLRKKTGDTYAPAAGHPHKTKKGKRGPHTFSRTFLRIFFAPPGRKICKV